MNRATELANLALDKRGYVVMGHAPEGPLPLPVVGEILLDSMPDRDRGEDVPGPFIVLSETDYADACEQALSLGLEPNDNIAGMRFFRLAAE